MHVRKNSLVIIDEAESTFPSERNKLELQLRTYIAEHGQHGHDIVLMGQDFKQLHTWWKARTQQKNYYVKRTAAGKPNEFSVTIQMVVMKGDKVTFEEVQHIKGIEYDTDYFGAYASHKEGTTNKETFIDERANVWNNPILKKWLPVYLGVFIVACYLVYDAFTGDALISESVKQQTQPVTAKQPLPPPPIKQLPQQQQPTKVVATNTNTTTNFSGSKQSPKTPLFIDPNIIPDPQPDLIDHLSQTGRIRLTGYMRFGNKSQGWIEWRSDSFAVLERISFDTLKTLGWTVLVNQDMDMAILQNYHKRYIATSWPLPDPKGKTTSTQNDEIKTAQIP